jgi:hypothetical protein
MPGRWVDGFNGGSWRRRDVERFARAFGVARIAEATRFEELYGRPRHDIVPAVAPAGELEGYAQA